MCFYSSESQINHIISQHTKNFTAFRRRDRANRLISVEILLTFTVNKVKMRGFLTQIVYNSIKMRLFIFIILCITNVYSCSLLNQIVSIISVSRVFPPLLRLCRLLLVSLICEVKNNVLLVSIDRFL